MSFKRVFYWTCDFCDFEVRKEAFGLPNGWDYIMADVKTGMPVRSICDDCIANGYVVKDHKIVEIKE
jgi:hypothetical protein